LLGSGEGSPLAYGFEVGSYDPRYPLVIDPVVLVYSTYLGGSNHEEIRCIAVNGSGNAYVAGYSHSTDFPIVSGYDASKSGDDDVVVAKLNATGTALLYSTFIGGSNHDEAWGIAIDGSGNAYVAGSTRSTNFPVTQAAYQAVNQGDTDAFIVKLDPTGGALLYSSLLGGHHEEIAYSIALDGAGNAYIAGSTRSADYPTKSAYQGGLGGDGDAFVAKFNPSASGAASLVYSTYIGGGEDDEARGIAVDTSGQAYITGTTQSRANPPPSFPTTASAYQNTNQGDEDAFLTKLSAAGNTLLYSTYLGGGKEDYGYAIAIDNLGGAYIAGQTRSDATPGFPISGDAYQGVIAGNEDSFVAHLDTAASGPSSLIYSTFLGGRNTDTAYGIAYVGARRIWVTGLTKFTNNPPYFPTLDAYQSANQGDEDAYIAKLDTGVSGAAGLLYSTLMGGSGEDYGRAVALDSNGGVYVAGFTQSSGNSGFPTTASAFQVVNAGGEDGFVLKISEAAPLSVATTSLPGATQGSVYSQTLTASGGIGPYSWALIAGSLPAGLALSGGGNISGTPTGTGTSTFTVRVTDSNGSTATRILSISVAPALAITTTSLPHGTVGAFYSDALTATGGYSPYTWSIVSGSLPGGLTLGSLGTISGTPTTYGTSEFTVQVTDSASQTATLALSLTVVFPLTVTTSNAAGGTVGVAYSQPVAASGGSSPYTWALISGSLPPGLTLSAAGLISGTPTTTGTYTFTVEVTDSLSDTATKTLSIGIAASLSIVTTSLANATVGVSYNTGISATGGYAPYTWSVYSGSLPPGVTLGSGGLLSGTPTTAGTYTFTVKVSDTSLNSDTSTFSILVAPALVVTSTAPPHGTAGSSYTYSLTATGGYSPYTWSIVAGSLPPGLIVSAAGVISGTATTAGSYSFTVRVTDSAGNTRDQTLSIMIDLPVSITTTSLPGIILGGSYNQTLAATGGTPPYTWSLVSGSLPPNLTLSGAGLISGITVVPGTYTFTVQVTDAALRTGARTLSIATGNTPNGTGVVVPVATAVATYDVVTVLGHTTVTTTASPPGGSPPAGYIVPSASQYHDIVTTAIYTGLVHVCLSYDDSGLTAQQETFLRLLHRPSVSSPWEDVTTTRDTAGNTICGTVTSLSPFVVVLEEVSIATAALPAATEGITYNQILSATGGTAPYSWTLISGGLPPGLFLSSSGQISGTPTATGTFNFTVQVTDANSATSTRSFSLLVTMGSTAVNLISFTGAVDNGQVILQWQTGAEVDNEGFEILRSENKVDHGSAIQRVTLIPAQGSIAAGANYQFIDTDATLVPGRTYYYTLVDVDTVGKRTLHGPMAVKFEEGMTAKYDPRVTTITISSGNAVSSGSGSADWIFLLLLFGGVVSARSFQWSRRRRH
jgi:hypothetical protein